jgi:thiamine transport system permease protein
VRVLGAPGQATVEVEIWRRATQLGDTTGAALLAVGQLVAIGAVLMWSAWQQRRHSRALALRPLARRRRPSRGREGRLVATVAVVTAVIVVAPLAALVERSVRGRDGYTLSAWRTLGEPEVRRGIRLGIDPLDALATSLRTAAVATLVAVLVGGLAAVGIVAARRAGRLLDTGLMLPIATSAVTVGFGMLITFDDGWYDWRSSWWLVPIGQALVAVPFVVRTALPVLRGIDPRLHEAAATLGASPVRAWREVTLSHLWRPLVSAAGVAAAIALGEFGATSFLSRTGSETVPVAIEQLLGRTGAVLQAQAYALSVVLAAATVAVVLLLEPPEDRISGMTRGAIDRRRHEDARRS